MPTVGEKLTTVDDLKAAYDVLVKKAEIVNNLTATTSGNPLDATQGKALKDSMNLLPCYVLDCGTISSLPATRPSSGTNTSITSDMIVIGAELGTPSAQGSDWTVNTGNGSLTISGTIYRSTTLKLYLVKSR